MLEIAQVGVRLIREHRPGGEDAVGVEEFLDATRHGVQLVAVLPPHEGCHHPTGAVLGFEVAAVREHEVDEIFREASIALDRRRLVEAFDEHEVDVPVLGMPEDDGVFVAVAVEEHG